MLHLDPATLLFASGLLVVLCSVYFVLNTVFGVNDQAGRIWTVSFLCGVIVTGVYIIWGLDQAAWWVVAIGNGMFTLTGGMFWSGTRVFNGRRSLALYPVLAGLAVAGAAVLGHSTPHGWGGTTELFLSVVVFGALAAVEMMRGAGRANLNGRIFSAAMALAAAVYLARLVAYLAYGPNDPRFTTYFGTTAATTVFIVLTFCASVTLTVLRSQTASRDVAHRHTDAPLLTAPAFDTLARGWLARADGERRGLTLAEARLHGLHDITAAFGGMARDRVVDDFVAVVTTTMPAICLPARAADDRLVFLFPASDIPAARAKVRHIANAAEARSTEPTGIPMTIGISLAHTADVGYELESLEREVASHRVMVMTTGLTDAEDG